MTNHFKTGPLFWLRISAAVCLHPNGSRRIIPSMTATAMTKDDYRGWWLRIRGSTSSALSTYRGDGNCKVQRKSLIFGEKSLPSIWILMIKTLQFSFITADRDMFKMSVPFFGRHYKIWSAHEVAQWLMVYYNINDTNIYTGYPIGIMKILLS